MRFVAALNNLADKFVAGWLLPSKVLVSYRNFMQFLNMYCNASPQLIKVVRHSCIISRENMRWSLQQVVAKTGFTV